MRRAVWVAILVAAMAGTGSAQVQMGRTDIPEVTAENEPWYLDREPIPFSGERYYPAGALVFFNANEMVRSGYHLGIPIFTRTTIEPNSIVYVPVGRGLMQPYERRRSGELAGTVGSRTPAFPVAVATADTSVLPQAAAPPTLVASSVATVPLVRPSLGIREYPAGDEQPVATSGRQAPAVQRSHVRIGGNPSGLNAIYIEFGGTRWFSTGEVVEVDPATMERAGEYHGFAVWRGKNDGRIYVATAREGTLTVPYSRQKTNLEIR